MENKDLRPELAEAIRETAKQTVIEYEQRQQARREDCRKSDTVTLMENYTILKAYAEGKTPGTPTSWGDAFMDSIVSSKIRTSIMVAAIDQALADTATDFKAAGQGYKWEAYKRRYILGESYDTIADELNCGKNSPARWCKEVMTQVAVHLFGVDGLKRW